MKRLILITIFVLFTIGLFALKIYITDGACDYTDYNISSVIESIGDQHYEMTGDFEDVPFTQNMTTIGFEEAVIGISHFRALVVSKTNNVIEFYTSENIPNQTINEFYIQISNNHAVWCKNKLIEELDGIIPTENIYAGTIGLSFNLLGVATIFDIDIVSSSKLGMNDNDNEEYGVYFTAEDKLIVSCHGSNQHIQYDYTTYIGDIVTVSYGDNTGVNQGSYGPGLEFFVNETNCQSYATPKVAGMFAKMKVLTNKSYDEIREALRTTAINPDGVNWNEMNGYGNVNYELALAELEGIQTYVVNEILPSNGGNIAIDELESIAFSIDAYDPNGNTLEYNWELDGIEVSTTDFYNFTTDYSSAGSYIVTLDVTDDSSNNSLYYNWNITVNDVDQIIVVNEILPTPGNITIDELESIAFSIDAYDPDGNTLEYNWELDGIEVSTTDFYNFTTDYSSAGSYIVTLDVDNNSLNYTWNITVNDVDQTIVVNEILPTPGDITIDELESIAFLIDAYDPDGNPLEYSWELDGTEVSTTDSYDFITDYSSAGSYIVTLDVDNNSLNYTWNITVNDVDQTIVVNEILPTPGDITIDELESIAFSIDAYDPDGNGNTLEYSWELDGTEVSITDSYDFITDYSSAGSYIVTLDVDNNSLNYTWDITVNDVDQTIVINSLEPESGVITMFEMETLTFYIDAYDPDGNELGYLWELDGEEVSITETYNFSPDYNAAGEYLITLFVTDNFTENSLEFEWDIIVEEMNPNINFEVIEPSPSEFCISQNEIEDFMIIANNPDGDIYFSWILDGIEVSTVDNFHFDSGIYLLGNYNLQLNVSTDTISRETMQFNWGISVIVSNQQPVADAGEDQTISSSALVKLNGFDSYDPEGENLTYRWIAPEEIVLSNSEIVNPTFKFENPDITGEVEFRIQLIVNDGICNSEPNEIVITIVENTIINDPVSILQLTELHSNYPNPFNPTTTIKFDVQDDETATLTIFNVKGQIVQNRNFASGTHNFEWNAQNNSSGVYYYQLKSSSYTKTRKMILLK